MTMVSKSGCFGQSVDIAAQVVLYMVTQHSESVCPPIYLFFYYYLMVTSDLDGKIPSQSTMKGMPKWSLR